ncbi:MAG: hypothetical protein U0736_21950 [Gemmataceae bacterium]
MAKRSVSHSTDTILIPPEQWDMPVTFDPAGNLVTLREATQPGHAPLAPLAALSPEKQAELTVKRIEAQPDFEVAMLGGGLIDRDRAIQEVRANTDVGRVLMEIEQRVVQNLLDEVVNR